MWLFIDVVNCLTHGVQLNVEAWCYVFMSKQPEYKILICDDNQHYIRRLCEKISAINYENKDYHLSITAVSSSQLFFNHIKSVEFDIIILDTCFTNGKCEQVEFDILRQNLFQDYYGPDLYRYAKENNPQALIFILSNLPIMTSRTLYNNVDAKYFCKETTMPADIAKYIKNYFDTECKRLYNNVFVVYGHNESMHTNVVKYIRRIGINTFDLFEYSSAGIQTIFDVLNTCANTVECAIVLLSGDDIALNCDQGTHKVRARQNVIFEMGFFAGFLGRDKVIVLYEPSDDFEFPSDIKGIYYTEYGCNTKWKSELQDHLKKMGFDFK